MRKSSTQDRRFAAPENCLKRLLSAAILPLLLVTISPPAAAAAPELTALETRWLQGIWPVVTYAKAIGLPLDLVVQPQAAAGAVPLASAFIDGRCKLVLTLRGSTDGEKTLARMPDALRDSALELMAAHELGHCRRHLDGAWLQSPSGFAPRAPDGLSDALRASFLEMQAQRREEGFADLVGLAWTRWQHPDQYAALRAWLVDERDKGRVDGSPHDTLAWIRDAADPASLAGATIFDAAAARWTSTLHD